MQLDAAKRGHEQVAVGYPWDGQYSIAAVIHPR
jgi:hypothetical protein